MAWAQRPISRSGDASEHEADGVAERVMRMPEAEACPCGGGCPRCDHAPHRLLRETAHSSGAAPIGAEQPRLVQAVLASAGDALDVSARSFMEQRFGRDFSEVRVHVDTAAAESAASIDALAYTVGSHIVFGPGSYEPHTNAGRQLLAHELAHVVQGDRSGTIHRQPSRGGRKKRKRDPDIESLAADPAGAHQVWKHLTSLQKAAVLGRMILRYGSDFAQSFLAYALKGTERLGVQGSNLDYRTPEWFQERGYRLRARGQGATLDSTVEFWVHPSGYEIFQIVSQQREIPAVEDCSGMRGATLEILDDTLETERSSQEALELEKKDLDKPQDRSSAEYCTRYDAYVASLKDMKARVEVARDDIETMRKELEDLKCATSDIDSRLLELEDLYIGTDVELSPVGLYGIECVKLPPPKDVPDDEE